MSTFLGMLGTGDFVTNERPENWRQGILREFPNGQMILTAIQSMMKKEGTNDPHFHWWTKTLPTQGGAVTQVYIDVTLSTAYVYATHQTTYGIAGGVLYVNVAEATADMIRVRHTVVLRDSDQPTVDVVGRVISVVKNGSSSYVAVKLLESDDNAGDNASSYNIATVDRILVMGSMQAEGSEMPDALIQQSTEYENYCQIFEEAIDLTRTAMKTKLRTEDAYKEAKRDALEQLGIQMEKNTLWGVPYSGTGDNGKPIRSSMGWFHFIKTYASSNVFNYQTNSETAYSGKTWLQSGEEWLDDKLERVFRYGDGEKLGVCGSGALLGINRLAKANGQIILEKGEGAYGIKILTWILPFGILHLKTHPLFSYEATNRNTILVVEPKHTRFRYIDDIFFKPDSEKEGGSNSKDGKNESWLCEGGYEFHYPNRHGIFNGVGVDNAN